MPYLPEFLNNSLTQWFLAALFFVGGIVLALIVFWIMGLVLRHICPKTRFKIDDVMIAELRRPVSLALLLSGVALGLGRLSTPARFELWAGKITEALFILLGAWALVRIVDALLARYVPMTSGALKVGGQQLLSKEVELQPVLRKLSGALIWLIAVILILRALGFDVSALLAGLGLGGAALALASRDTLANFFGSITVFVDRPFRLNDRIKIAGYDGAIVEMGLRTSRLRTQDNRVVTIPNSIFQSNPIENLSAEPYTKVTQTINIQAACGREKAEEAVAILRDSAPEAAPLVAPLASAPRSIAAIVSISGAVLTVTFSFFVPREADYFATVHGINLQILRRFEEAGIKLA
jgi:MscS family membrane protein